MNNTAWWRECHPEGPGDGHFSGRWSAEYQASPGAIRHSARGFGQILAVEGRYGPGVKTSVEHKHR